MKITLEIQDDLLIYAKRLAKKTGRPLRTVVEDSLRAVLAFAEEPREYKLPDLSVGDPESGYPLELASWQDLRAVTYGESKAR